MVRMGVVATTSRPRRTAMTVRRVVLVAVPAAAIAVVPVAPTRSSRVRIRRVRIRRVRTMRAQRVLQASRMDRVVRRVRPALPVMPPATPPSFAAGMCPRVSTPVRARRDRAAIRMQRVQARAVPGPAVRANPAARAASVVRRVGPARMPARASSAHSPRARKAIVHVETARRETVRKAACHAVRTLGPVALARMPRAPAAIVRTSRHATRVARRRTRVLARVRIGRMPLHAARVTKGCHATRIERLLL